jgi:hypothetical protein
MQIRGAAAAASKSISLNSSAAGGFVMSHRTRQQRQLEQQQKQQARQASIPSVPRALPDRQEQTHHTANTVDLKNQGTQANQ